MSHPIHLYRPQRTAPEDLEAIFVGREPLLQELLGRLGQWQPGASRQHYLIIGPRGIGKTCLLQLVQHRIRTTADLQTRWCPVAVAEDAYGITCVTDLLIESLRILAQETADSDLQSVYNQVVYDDDETRVTDLILDAFRKFHQSRVCGILLMVENVNRLLERQIRYEAEIHLLRKILIEEDWLVMIGTSPTHLSAVTDPEKPLFEFFQVKLLAELTPDEQQSMLQKLAILERKPEVEEELCRFHSRLRALYHFTGGNPRLTVMLYDLVAHQHITDVKTELDFLLDQLTPFYQSRMAELPEQEGKLLETMALMTEGCTPTELAHEARMPAKLVRALLTRLEKAGYVRREQRRQKRTVYIIPERFFRLWHQMNHSRAARGRIQYLLEFFSSWYATKEERDRVWNELLAKFERGFQAGDEDRVQDVAEYMQYVAAVSEGNERFGREFDLLRPQASRAGVDSIRSELNHLDQEYQDDGDYFLHKGYFLANDLGLHEQALVAFQKAIDLKKEDMVLLFNEAVALDKLGRKQEAQRAYERVLDFLSRRTEDTSGYETQDILLYILRKNMDSSLVKIAAYLLVRTADIKLAGSVLAILNDSELDWRREHCVRALGLLRSFEAVPTLLNCLQDEASNVRGRAATALGRLGAEQAVLPLIEVLRDEASDVRGSSAAALGRVASETYIPNLPRVMSLLIEEMKTEHGELPLAILRTFMRSAFHFAELDSIESAIDVVISSWLPGAEIWCKPYSIALEYLQSDRKPAILEQQHPEMREAVQLLVDVFDENQLTIAS